MFTLQHPETVDNTKFIYPLPSIYNKMQRMNKNQGAQFKVKELLLSPELAQLSCTNSY
jgi:hypothetical protein